VLHADHCHGRATSCILKTKEAKIQVKPEDSLPHRALAMKNGQNRGWNIFTLCFAAHTSASVKFPMTRDHNRPKLSG